MMYACVNVSLKMLMRHYLPKVVEKLRSTLVRRREAGINQQTLASTRCFLYEQITHTHIPSTQ
jgi:hypothetical protein